MTEAEAEKNTQITLIGTTVAKSGKEFVYEGETEACEGCPHSGNCLNLDEGIRYRITDVREGGQNLDCAIHDERSVRAVEVTEPPVVAQIETKKAFEGSSVTIEEDACDKTDCPAYEYCVPEGFDFGEEYEITEVIGDNDVDCHYDKSLKRVRLRKE